MRSAIKLSTFLFYCSLATLITALIISVIAPEEKVLGRLLGLIYLHVGFVLGALLLFMTTAITASAFFLFKKRLFFVLSSNALILAFGSWIVYTALSMIIAVLGWGNINWQEPRLIIAIKVIFFVCFVFLLKAIVPESYSMALNIVAGIVTFILLANRGNMLHPESPIQLSNSIPIKLFAVANIALIVASLGLLLAARTLEELKR